MSQQTRDLTVLKLLAKRRTVVFIANACDLMPSDVIEVAGRYMVLRADGSTDVDAATAAAAKLEAAAAPKLPTREPPPAPARPDRLEAGPAAPAPRPAAAGVRQLNGYALIDVALIDTDGRNVRDELGDLTELAVSIRSVGILQPLGVVPHRGRFLLEYGHRRLGGALIAGLTQVPCIVRAPRSDTAARIERLIENLHRKDLAPLEEATAYRILLQEGLTQSEVARRVGVSASTVSTRLSLLDLPHEAQAMVRDKRLPLVEATELAKQVRKSGSGSVVNKPAEPLPDHWATHPLLPEAYQQCVHWSRRRYGGKKGACGPCIEAVIRADEGLRLLTSPRPRKDHE